MIALKRLLNIGGTEVQLAADGAHPERAESRESRESASATPFCCRNLRTHGVRSVKSMPQKPAPSVICR
jgi:hypothetical protein